MPFLTPDTPPENQFVCRRLRIPASADFLSLVTGALASLLYETNFEQHGTLTPEDTAQLFKRMMLEMETTDCMIGEIKAFMRETLPDGVLPCNGGMYNREDYPDLYAVLPLIYIVDGDNFTVPQLNERGLIGWSMGGGGAGYNPGDEVGEPFTFIDINQMPPHDHTTHPHTHIDIGHQHTYNNSAGITIPVVTPGEALALAPNFLPGLTNPAQANLGDEVVTMELAGGGQALDIRNPDTVVMWGIVAR